MPKRKGPLASAHGRDFKKRKAKVGHKATKQANVTKINVKSRQLYLPTQRLDAGSSRSSKSTLSEQQAAKLAVVRRPLHEVLAQLHHYSPRPRIGALQELKGLLKEGVVGRADLSAVLEGMLDLLQDTDAEVRSAMLSVFKVLPLHGGRAKEASAGGASSSREPADLAPFADLVASHLTSALASLDQSIRKDALVATDVLVQALGSTLIVLHLPTLLRSLRPLLDRPPRVSKRQAKSAAVKQSDAAGREEMWAARLAVTRSLLGLVRLAPTLPPATRPSTGSHTTMPSRGTRASASAPTLSWSLRRSSMIVLREERTGSSANRDARVEAARSSTEPQHDISGAVAELLPKLQDYVLEMGTQATPSRGQGTEQQHDPHTDSRSKQQDGGSSKGAANSGSRVVRHQAEGGLALEVLSAIVETVLAAQTRMPSFTAANEAAALVKSLTSLFPIELAEGRMAAADEGDAQALAARSVNLGLIEIMVGTGRLENPVALETLRRISKAQGLRQEGGGTAEFGAKLVRLVRAIVMGVYGGTLIVPAGAEWMEELLDSLDECMGCWPEASANRRACLLLLCDSNPRRPTARSFAWMKKTAESLPSIAVSAPQLCQPFLQLVLRHVYGKDGASDGTTNEWLPHLLLGLLKTPSKPSAGAGCAKAALCHLNGDSQKRVLDLVYRCTVLPDDLLQELAHIVRRPTHLDDETRQYLLEVLHHRRHLMSPRRYLGVLLEMLDLGPECGWVHAVSVARLVAWSLERLRSTPAADLCQLLNMVGKGLEALVRSSGTAPVVSPTTVAAVYVLHLVWGSQGSSQVEVRDDPGAPGQHMKARVLALAAPDSESDHQFRQLVDGVLLHVGTLRKPEHKGLREALESCANKEG